MAEEPRELTMAQALNLALREEMARDEAVVVLGEDGEADGGAARVTEGLLECFGGERVLDPPLAEAMIVGTAVGMATYGLKPVAEMPFSGLSYAAMHELESHASRVRWRSRGAQGVPLVVRIPYGVGVRALDHHLESHEAWFAHTPGLKMVVPSGPRNARDLLVRAIRDPDPVIFFEPTASYQAYREVVPEAPGEVDIGKAQVVREGTQVTLVAWGAMLPRALTAAERLAEGGVQAEVIDVLTLSPLDDETLVESARKTGRVVVVHEAPRSFGPGAEIIARLDEGAFWFLQTPVRRVTGFDAHVPSFAREQLYLPSVEAIVRTARAALAD